jgi:hypothetical protein
LNCENVYKLKILKVKNCKCKHTKNLIGRGRE